MAYTGILSYRPKAIFYLLKVDYRVKGLGFGSSMLGYPEPQRMGTGLRPCTLRVRIANNHQFPQTCTIIAIAQNPDP